MASTGCLKQLIGDADVLRHSSLRPLGVINTLHRDAPVARLTSAVGARRVAPARYPGVSLNRVHTELANFAAPKIVVFPHADSGAPSVSASFSHCCARIS